MRDVLFNLIVACMALATGLMFGGYLSARREVPVMAAATASLVMTLALALIVGALR